MPAGHVTIAAIDVLLGRVAAERGDLETAERLLGDALAALEKRLGPMDKGLADPLAYMAEVQRKKRDLERAEALAARVLALRDATSAPDHPARAEARAALGRIRELSGDVAGGRKLHEEALALRTQVFGAEHPAVATSLLDLGDLERRAGNATAAEDLYKRAIALQEKAFGAEHGGVADALEGLAALYAGTGKVALALKCAGRAAEIRERQAALVVAGGSEAQKRKFLATLRAGTDFAVTLHAARAPRDDAARKLALVTILQRKGRVLDVMADTLASARRRLSATDQAIFDELAAARAGLAQAAWQGPRGASMEAFQADLRSRAEKARALEEKLGGRSDVLLAQETPVTLERVQAVIPEGAALVEIFLYWPSRAADREVDSREGPARYAAYVLDPAGKIGFVDLGEAHAIDALARELREGLSSPDGNADRAARELGARLLGPIRPLLGATSRVLLSPDGALTLVPFAALLDGQGRRLVEALEITYLTSGRDLLRLSRQRPPGAAPLVVANPAFGSAENEGSALALLDDEGSASRGLEKAHFDPLPGTASEARAIGAVLPGAAVRVDLEATEAALKEARSPRILHVATHGFFLAGTSRAAAGARGLELEPAQEGPWLPDDPLLRSGLALAGANTRKGGGGDDGILTALEAAGLDLSGTELTVLSACETGLGDVQSGEGVYGLRRALFVAGTRTLVASLWKVADEETRDLMVGYYQRLLRGEGRSAAMRAVQIAMLGRKETANPYFWASFGVFGDPAPLSASGAPALPGATSAKVAPGARGCACAIEGAGGRDADGWAAVLAGAAVSVVGLQRRKRKQR